MAEFNAIAHGVGARLGTRKGGATGEGEGERDDEEGAQRLFYSPLVAQNLLEFVALLPGEDLFDAGLRVGEDGTVILPHVSQNRGDLFSLRGRKVEFFLETIEVEGAVGGRIEGYLMHAGVRPRIDGESADGGAGHEYEQQNGTHGDARIPALAQASALKQFSAHR